MKLKAIAKRMAKRIVTATLAFAFMSSAALFASADSDPPPNWIGRREAWDRMSPESQAAVWERLSRRPTPEQIEEMRNQVYENEGRLSHRFGVGSFQGTRDRLIMRRLGMSNSEFQSLPIERRQELRVESGIADPGPQITQEEIDRLREQYGDRTPRYFQEAVAALMTHYSGQFGLGPFEASEMVQHFAQEHADLWAEAINTGALIPVNNRGWRNTQANIYVSTIHYRPWGESSRVRRSAQIQALNAAGYNVRSGAENARAGGRLTSDYLLPGFVDMYAYAMLFSTSSPHFRNWLGFASSEGRTVYIGVGYARRGDSDDFFKVLKFFV